MSLRVQTGTWIERLGGVGSSFWVLQDSSWESLQGERENESGLVTWTLFSSSKGGVFIGARGSEHRQDGSKPGRRGLMVLGL